jgi:acetyl-CoA synthetase
MGLGTVYHVKPSLAASALVTAAQHRVMSNHAAHEPDGYWREEAKRIDWIRFPELAETSSFDGDVRISWFADGLLNVSVNCIDRHLRDRGDQPALIWQGEAEDDSRTLTYAELHAEVCRLGNALRALGIGKGDRVAIYLPMVVEGVVAMLACARIGAVHVVMFAGFSASSIADRLADSGARLMITADEGRRGGKRVALKQAADAALATPGAAAVEHVLVLRVTGAEVPMQDGRDRDYAVFVASQPATCEPETMGAEDPLMLLYTSGSTGKPKGVLHTTAGYLVWARFTQEAVFDYRAPDVFWCTADIGWVTGHSYSVYGPLANGGTTLIYEGTPSWPEPGRWWRIIDKYKVATFYTAPTAIRALMREDPAALRATSRESLRVIGTVGEPINPEAWLWYYHEVGGERCPVVDTWWQTETGGIMIAPLPGAVAQKPGSATLPLPGVCPVLVDEKGTVLEGEAEGHLCISRSWPGQARTIWGDHARFMQTYFSAYPGLYFSGDGARRDADGYFWITGRVDDVINVSGHRIGSAEVEAAFGAHDDVAESAVVGVPHDIKGQALFAFVVLKREGTAPSGLEAELSRHVGQILGRYAAPDTVLIVPDLPKTRSGKIMRRILRKIATKQTGELGDTTTLADPTIVQTLIARLEEQS